MKAEIVLALAVLQAAANRENSYDQEASSAAYKAAQKDRETQPDNIYAGCVDYSKFYRVSMQTASKTEVGGEELKSPVYLLLQYCWNDAIAWARETLARNKVDMPQGH